MGTKQRGQVSASANELLTARACLLALLAVAMSGIVSAEDPSIRSVGSTFPGTNNYPIGEVAPRIVSESRSEVALETGVVDTDGKLAYFATNVSLPQIVMIAYGKGHPLRVGSVPFMEYSACHSSVIDSTRGYGYFACESAVVKVKLRDAEHLPEVLGRATTQSNEAGYTGVIDEVNGYAYFGGLGKIVKIALGEHDADPTRIGSVTPAGFAGLAQCSAIDVSNGVAYFGSSQPNARLFKVSLGVGEALPAVIGSAAIPPTTESITAGAIDLVDGYGYFASSDPVTGTPSKIHVFELGEATEPPVWKNSLTLSTGERIARSAVFDESTRTICFNGTRSGDSILFKYALSNGPNLPVNIDKAILPNPTSFVAIDGLTDQLIVTEATEPAEISLLSLGSAEQEIAEVGRVSLSGAPYGHNPAAMAIHPNGKYGYIGTDGSPAQVYKYLVGAGHGQPVITSAIELGDDEAPIGCGLLDPVENCMYFGTRTSPGRIVKVNMGAGDAEPVRLGALILPEGENNLWSGVLDAEGGYAYFGTYSDPAKVIKVSLNRGEAVPARIEALTISTEASFRTAAYDYMHGFAYFATSSSLVKVNIEEPSSSPFVSDILDVGWYHFSANIQTCAIDVSSGALAFGDANGPDIIKVQIGDRNTASQFVGVCNIDTSSSQAAVFEPETRSGFFAGDDFWDSLSKVTFSDAGLPQDKGPISNWHRPDRYQSGALDEANGYMHFGESSLRLSIVKVAPGLRNEIHGTRVTLSESGLPRDIRFYSHEAVGNARFSIYDDSEPKQLLWESPSIENLAANGDVIAPIFEGTPQSLQLDAGDYWLCWQIDTGASVPSYTRGSVGDGFVTPHVFGAAPDSISRYDVTSNDSVWTISMTFTPPAPSGWVAGGAPE